MFDTHSTAIKSRNNGRNMYMFSTFLQNVTCFFFLIETVGVISFSHIPRKSNHAYYKQQKIHTFKSKVSVIYVPVYRAPCQNHGMRLPIVIHVRQSCWTSTPLIHYISTAKWAVLLTSMIKKKLETTQLAHNVLPSGSGGRVTMSIITVMLIHVLCNQRYMCYMYMIETSVWHAPPPPWLLHVIQCVRI